jgi:hypothetical protein
VGVSGTVVSHQRLVWGAAGDFAEMTKQRVAVIRRAVTVDEGLVYKCRFK